MKEKIEAAIEILASLISVENAPDEALKYSQGALNLAHVLATLDNLKQ